MAGNALSTIGGPPPAPNPQPQEPLAGAGSALMPAGMAMGGPAPSSPQAPGAAAPPVQPPAPSHQQTVAALRHFDALENELKTFLADPDLGKADLKSKIIDGATRLVATGIMTAAEAVSQLGTFPEKPFDQKQWVMTHFVQTIHAANMVLAHHQAAFAGQGPPDQVAGPDDHANVMAGVLSHYRGLNGAG